MEVIHFINNTDAIEILVLVGGYILGVSTKFKKPLMLMIFLLRVLDWWIKNHPHGKKMSQETNLDEEFYRLFGHTMEKHKHLFDKRYGKDKATESLVRKTGQTTI